MSGEAFGEPILVCVQCGGKYKQSNNVDGSCCFHAAESSGRGNPPCCGMENPCQVRRHRPEHHNEYPYVNFFKRAMNVLNYSDTKDTWLALEEEDMGDGEKQRAGVYLLKRWQTRGQLIDSPLLLVRVGTVWHSSKSYYFGTFTEDQLDSLTPDPAFVGDGKGRLIHRSGSEEEFSQAEFLFDAAGAHVTGVRLSVKPKSNEKPSISTISFIAKPLAKGDVVEVQNGAFVEYGPDGGLDAYTQSLPAPKKIGLSMDDGHGLGPDRPARIFKGRGPLATKLRLKAAALTCTGAARDSAGLGSDSFEGKLSVVATDPSAPVVVMEMKAEWRLVGDRNWTQIAADQLEFPGTPVPLTCPPLQAMEVPFKVRVRPTNADVAMAGERRFDRSMVARARPLRLRLTAVGLDDSSASLVIEYVQQAPRELTKKSTTDGAVILSVDNPEKQDRVEVKVEKGSSSSYSIRVGSQGLSDAMLRKLAFQACAGSESVVKIENLSRSGGKHTQESWALVDISCQRVYALKILLTRKDVPAATLAYVAVPLYGCTEPTRPVALANDSFDVIPAELVAKAGELSGAAPLPSDDDFDDGADDAATPAPGGGSGGAAVAGLSATDGSAIASHLASIDAKFGRIVDLLEQLVQQRK